jgi:hypothetical protein
LHVSESDDLALYFGHQHHSILGLGLASIKISHSVVAADPAEPHPIVINVLFHELNGKSGYDLSIVLRGPSNSDGHTFNSACHSAKLRT